MAASAWTPVPEAAAGWTPVPESAAAPSSAPAQEGFVQSVGSNLGIQKPQQSGLDQLKEHPVQTVLETQPAVQAAEGLYQGVKRSGGELLQAARDAFAGNRAGAATHAVKAIPIVGPGIDKAADQYADKNYSGEAGTLLGTAAQVAPAVLGAADSAGVPRPDTSLSNVTSAINPTAMKQSAGQLLQTVAKDANKVPVQLDNSGDAALQLMDWQKKTQLGPTINKYLNRITNPKLGPLTYSEARDYYQLLGRMSADEASKLPPVVQRNLTQMVIGLKEDIGDAADQVGRAAEYYKGMKDYGTAMRLQGWYDFTKNLLTKEALSGIAKGAGVGAGGAIGYQVYKQSQQ